MQRKRLFSKQIGNGIGETIMNWINNYDLFILLTSQEKNSYICENFYYLHFDRSEHPHNYSLHKTTEKEKQVVFRFLAYLIAQVQVMIECNLLYRDEMNIEEIKKLSLQCSSEVVKIISTWITDDENSNFDTNIVSINNHEEFDYYCDEIIQRLLNGQQINKEEMICLMHSLESFIENISDFFETSVYLRFTKGERGM